MLVFRAEVAALRRDPGEMERFIALARAAAPGDPEIEGSALAGARGMLALLDGPRASRWARLGITDRQADVLRLVATGISNKEIAARLHLSPRTVEKHVENLLRITAAQSRTQLVAIAGPESD